jgi:hypothetical protein
MGRTTRRMQGSDTIDVAVVLHTQTRSPGQVLEQRHCAQRHRVEMPQRPRHTNGLGCARHFERVCLRAACHTHTIQHAAERRRNEPGELFCLLSFVQSVLYGSYEIYTYSMTNNDRILMCI